ncbi:hypothetical protein AB0D27_43215 [Streptomyces sp. NPDC048415]|uniref:hypothetical protein n=1 Tax=Streptomyces sp. NPDC048415 TaxID=3154822 RepID=UPI00344477F2
MPRAQSSAVRAEECDELIARMAGLAVADPPLRPSSHPASRRLIHEPMPVASADYQHREDLIDALLCAWTAAPWSRHGRKRCQVLGEESGVPSGTVATVIAPARPAQRRGRTAD